MQKNYTPFYAPMFSASARLDHYYLEKLARCTSVGFVIDQYIMIKTKEIEEMKWYHNFMSEK